ncbi:hypothetical protein L915_01610 [Phytophthora nicotianae]|uniref:Uncharacterized protein n=1 Tax=Phytophthora nicotianae TaxID=4792 RepID=W2HJL5_PHYNI|nr:hypothetical protein L915_01610 [Phytophthora nicotianae]
MDVEVERDHLRRYDMAEFSVKNKLPEPQESKDLADVVAALEVLSLLVNEMYTQRVADLVDAARRFLLVLRKTKTMQGAEAVPEIVAWIDDRFETFRSFVAQGDLVAADSVGTHFQFNHESYARVVQRVTNLKVEAALKLSAAQKPTSRQKKSNTRATANSGSRHGRGAPVPQEVVAALPIRKGKKLCMKFLSSDGCPGEGDTCVFDYRGHFVPVKLPVIVKNFIIKNYGGLRNMEALQNCRSVGWSSVGGIPEGRDVLPLHKSYKSVRRSRASLIHGKGEQERVNVSQPALSGRLRNFLTDQQHRYTLTLRASEKLLSLQHLSACNGLASVMKQYGVDPPGASPTWILKNATRRSVIDRDKQCAYSELLRRSKMSLPDFIRLVRGETSEDPRPNKALGVPDHLPCWRSYKYRDEWRQIVTHGIRPTWSSAFTSQQQPPKNHGSALRALNAVIKSLRKGQDEDRYLILDIELLSSFDGVTCSPFGAVQKGEADITDDARVIHDLSCSKGSSVSDQAQEESQILVTYDGACTGSTGTRCGP